MNHVLDSLLTYRPQIDVINHQTISIGILRLDIIDKDISGNKWFKLKYNLQQAKLAGKDSIITFGGAFSNHIVATAVACEKAGLKSYGIIRGEETAQTNPTLSYAQAHGMKLLFVSREEYSQKTDGAYLQRLHYMYPTAFIIPEGGNNLLGEKGCQEILNSQTHSYNKIFCAVGTGATFNGLAQSLLPHQYLLGINVLKYEANSLYQQAEILNTYHFGGYAKHTKELLEFKHFFESTYHIPLDYVYTAKSFYAAFDYINQNKIKPDDKLLIIHCGGLQGNEGYEQRYNLKPNRQVNEAHGK